MWSLCSYIQCYAHVVCLFYSCYVHGLKSSYSKVMLVSVKADFYRLLTLVAIPFRVLPMELCDVILRTNRVRCALNMEILDLLKHFWSAQW